MLKCDFNKVAATLLKSHFGMGVLLYISCIFSEHLFLRTPPGGCFCIWFQIKRKYIVSYCKLGIWAIQSKYPRKEIDLKTQN